MFIVMNRSAKMPTTVKAQYRRIALVEVAEGYGPDKQPAMIRENSKGIVRILEIRERLHLGRRPRGNTAAEIAQRELQAEADRLNNGVQS